MADEDTLGEGIDDAIVQAELAKNNRIAQEEQAKYEKGDFEGLREAGKVYDELEERDNEKAAPYKTGMAVGGVITVVGTTAGAAIAATGMAIPPFAVVLLVAAIFFGLLASIGSAIAESKRKNDIKEAADAKAEGIKKYQESIKTIKIKPISKATAKDVKLAGIEREDKRFEKKLEAAGLNDEQRAALLLQSAAATIDPTKKELKQRTVDTADDSYVKNLYNNKKEEFMDSVNIVKNIKNENQLININNVREVLEGGKLIK